MFVSLLRMLKAPSPPSRPDLRMSVAVLLLEAARQDDTFDSRERAVIAALLTRKFELTEQECEALLEAGAVRAAQMVQLHGHTSHVFEEMTPPERVGMIEMLWEVAYADGVLDPEEDLLIRRISGLIHVTDRERVVARQDVLKRLGRSL